jgi:PTH1 family peptidyl-tRNA hydrolase
MADIFDLFKKISTGTEDTKTPPEYIIAGLGNPGRDYVTTRHNAGFLAMDILADQLGCKVDKLKFQGLYGQTTYKGTKLYLLKPQTFMNLSGKSVLQISAYFNIPPQRIIVMFDDISLEPGKLRVRSDGSAGGHNGIKSIIAELGSQDFPRVKIGVGSKPHKDADLAQWVLSGFSAGDDKAMESAFQNAGKAALCVIEHGVQEAANRYNGNVKGI